MHEIYRAYNDFLDNCAEKKLNRKLIGLQPLNAREVSYQDKTYVNMSSNDYLGLRFHPALIQRFKEWTDLYGTGSGASRLVTGNLDLYAQLENKIAKWKSKESCLIMNSGFQCNTSILPTLFDAKILGDEPLVFTDKLIHASMHHGCKLAGIKQIRFHHNDTNHLSELIEKHKKSNQPKFILTESVFSMDGDIAPLEQLYALRDKHQACLIVDEAHAVGILGSHGQGIASKADIIIGTCGKAIGSFGAYVACSELIKNYLIQHCSGLIYSTSLPPGILGAIDAAVNLIPNMNKERNHVIELSNTFRSGLRSIGLSCANSETQIIPAIIGDTEETLRLADKIKDKRFWVSAIRPPTVPHNTSRIRFAISAAHQEDDVNSLLNIISDNYKKLAA